MLLDPHWFLRIAMASVFLFHGATKDIGGFSEKFQLHIVVAILVVIAEVAGGLGYLAGGFTNQPILGLTVTQWASLAVIPVLIGAISMVHFENGFSFMDNGFEYQMVLTLIALYFLFSRKN